jgi:hypothetical protein
MRIFTLTLLALSSLSLLAEESKKTDLLTKGLDGWSFFTKDGEQPIDPTWKFKDGIISTTGAPTGYIRTKGTFKNYTLNFEWRWQAGSENNNSGILVHVTTPGAAGVWPKSFEAQLQQDNAGDFWCIGESLEAKGEHPENSRRWIRIADPKEKPLGEWNTMTVTCTETTIEVHVNGTLVNQGKKLSTNQGAIAFQAEGAPIEIRNVIVKK